MQCLAAFLDSTFRHRMLSTRVITPGPCSLLVLRIEILLSHCSYPYSVPLSRASPAQANEAVRSAANTLLCKEELAVHKRRPRHAPHPPFAPPSLSPSHNGLVHHFHCPRGASCTARDPYLLNGVAFGALVVRDLRRGSCGVVLGSLGAF